MVFPPWKPTAAVDATNGKADGKDDDGNIEMSTLVRELNTLKALCSAAVRLAPASNILSFHFQLKFYCCSLGVQLFMCLPDPGPT